MKHILFCLIALLLSAGYVQASSQKDPDVVAKHVRNFIKKGNEAYRSGQYDVAETYYRDALQENPSSDIAQFNLALSLLRQSGDAQTSDTLRQMSKSYLNTVAESSRDASLIEKSYYNLGNLSFGEKDYATSIEMYKEVLRRNPSNLKARQNLRVAQIKLKEQQNNQGQDNKDQQQNKDQQKDKDQQQQQNQNQQNQNQQNQQEKDKKNKEQAQPQQNKDNKQQPPKEKSENGGAGSRPEISKENADKILKAAAKQEEQTRKRVEKNQKEQSTNRRIIGNPW